MVIYIYNIQGDVHMKKRVTFTIEEELVKKLKMVSEKTMIPQAKLVEKAIKDIIKSNT
jgi:predicted transcriptional regulator